MESQTYYREEKDMEKWLFESPLYRYGVSEVGVPLLFLTALTFRPHYPFQFDIDIQVG